VGSGFSGDLKGFFGSLEYGRPILGIKIPFSWIDSEWKEGTIEIAEASLQPGGSGLWKLAVQPDLVLKGVTVRGPKETSGQALRALGPKGINSVKITSFSYSNPKKSEVIDLHKIEITSRGVVVTGNSFSQSQKKLITEIFGKKVELREKME